MGGATSFGVQKIQGVQPNLVGATTGYPDIGSFVAAHQTTTPGLGAPPGIPGATDPQVLAAMRAASRQVAAKRGLQSTFLTTPTVTTQSTLGGFF